MYYQRRGPLRLDRFELETFGDRLALAIRKRGTTSVALGRAVNLSEQYISKYVVDDRIPTLEIAIRIADALDVSLDWLCGRKPRDREVIYESCADGR